MWVNTMLQADHSHSSCSRIAQMDIIQVRVPYSKREQSAVVDAGGVSNVLIKIIRKIKINLINLISIIFWC